MQLRPGLDETALTSREITGDQIDRIDPKHGHDLLVVSMEMRSMVLPTSTNIRMMIPKKRESSGTVRG